MRQIGYRSGLYLYLILISGLLFMNWSAREVLIILIVDMLISGVFTCGRILLAGVSGPTWFSKLFFNLFSVGFYATIHTTGWFIMTLFILLNLESEWGMVDFMALKLTYFALLFGYSMEFVFGYIATGKFKIAQKTEVFFGAFIRLVPYAVLLTFSAVLPELFGVVGKNNTILAVSVVGMKGLLDYVFSRIKESGFNTRLVEGHNSSPSSFGEKATNAGIQTQSSLSQDPPRT